MDEKPIQPLEYQASFPPEPFGRDYGMSALMTGLAILAFPLIASSIRFVLPVHVTPGALLALQLISLGFSVAAITRAMDVERTWWKVSVITINALLMGAGVLGACVLMVF